MTREDVEAWLEGYVHAWTTNDAADVARLFAGDATYATAPYREPWRGREAIDAGWLEHRDEPGVWTFHSEIVAVAGDLDVAHGRTPYADPQTACANLSLVRLDAGRCTEFREWWMEED